ncbi:MAG: ROK family protein [Oscillospiraceae bacterium]|nr:ROK family protein [Oscillospiraceae bacterium]
MSKTYRIGIDLGGTNIAAGIVDENYNIIVKGSVPTNADREAGEIIKDMGELCNDLLKEANLTPGDIKCAGIATPGAANRATGVVEYANNLPFRKFPIAETLKKYLDVETVLIENDANAAAKGEAAAGAAKGCNYAVMITLGTGLGGGVIIDKKVYSGFNYAGAELGHIVIEYNGRQCTCGRKGCWEAYSSATGLINITKDKLAVTQDTLMHKLVAENNGEVSGKTAFAAARQGDKAGIEVVNEYIEYLACGVTTIINIFQPEVLCIGGGVCKEGEYLTKPLTEIVNREQYTRDNPKKTEIKIASLGNDAGIIGAAVLDE